MKQHTIEVTIDKDGNPSIEVEGLTGKSCLDATKDLENALGVVTNRTVKHDMHISTPTTKKTTIKH